MRVFRAMAVVTACFTMAVTGCSLPEEETNDLPVDSIKGFTSEQDIRVSQIDEVDSNVVNKLKGATPQYKEGKHQLTLLPLDSSDSKVHKFALAAEMPEDCSTNSTSGCLQATVGSGGPLIGEGEREWAGAERINLRVNNGTSVIKIHSPENTKTASLIVHSGGTTVSIDAMTGEVLYRFPKEGSKNG